MCLSLVSSSINTVAKNYYTVGVFFAVSFFTGLASRNFKKHQNNTSLSSPDFEFEKDSTASLGRSVVVSIT